MFTNPTISDDGPTTASVTTDTEAYNPDNPTESPKLSTTTGNKNTQVTYEHSLSSTV